MSKYYCYECGQRNYCICPKVTYTNCKSCRCDRKFYLVDESNKCKDKKCKLCTSGFIIPCDCERKDWIEYPTKDN